MKKKVRIKIRTNRGVSKDTGIKYTKKVINKIFKNKTLDAAILLDSRTPKKIGIVKDIKIINKLDYIIVEGIFKTHLELNMDDIELHFGMLHAFLLDKPLKKKDIKRCYFYLCNSKIEKLLMKANELGLLLSKRDGSQVKNSWLTPTDIFSGK